MILFQKLSNNFQPLNVNFMKKWWHLIISQKLLFITIISSIMMINIFWALIPFFIEMIFEKASFLSMGIIFLMWVLVDYLSFYVRWLNGKFQLRCIHGIYQSAHQHLLTIDPLYHVYRSSGALLAKIERGARGYEQLLDEITFEFVPLFASLMVMIIALSRYSIVAMIIIVTLFIVMLGCGYYFARHGSYEKETSFIRSDDEFKAAAVENLSQVQLIRASFATEYMNDKLKKKIDHNMNSERSLWFFYASASFILNMVYIITIFILLVILLWQIKEGLTTFTSALGLAIAYIQSTRAITRITSPLRRYMRSYSAVNDLFNFMADFGKKGFPVLEQTKEIIISKQNLTLHLNKVTFNYETALLFNNCKLTLKCPIEQSHKLYGIIGASGTGKSTLLSILGGQIKPIHGNVYINDIDIYSINDKERKKLIALQGQIATSVSGNIKQSLLFGLPEDHAIQDEQLLQLLERVGLLKILKGHNSLDTMLGEGGLSLSGGQRQRLNFAGLYLRASYYKPLLILIDEPTSSLDDVSEATITEMIMELAKHSITLVIAHRLKTIAQACGIIDLSLLKKNNHIQVYDPNTLKDESPYYQALLQGKMDIKID